MKPLEEALKEAGRLIILSALAISIDYFAGLPGNTYVIITIVLRSIDKWVHKTDKTSLTGLLPF